MDVSLDQHIEVTSGVCGGRPRVAGHRIRVQDIVTWHEKEAFSPDEIVSQFPQLSLADVYAALTYYWDHRDEIEKQMRDDKESVESIKANTPSKLAQKLARMDNNGNSISSG